MTYKNAGDNWAMTPYSKFAQYYTAWPQNFKNYTHLRKNSPFMRQFVHLKDMYFFLCTWRGSMESRFSSCVRQNVVMCTKSRYTLIYNPIQHYSQCCWYAVSANDDDDDDRHIKLMDQWFSNLKLFDQLWAQWCPTEKSH